MLDANDLLILIKKSAVEAIEATKPADFCYGKVTSTSPLKITVEQKMTLGKAQLILTRNVTDYKTKVSTKWESSDTDVKTKEVTIHNGLKTDDEVILLRKKGGQKYLVLDRVVNT